LPALTTPHSKSVLGKAKQ